MPFWRTCGHFAKPCVLLLAVIIGGSLGLRSTEQPATAPASRPAGKVATPLPDPPGLHNVFRLTPMLLSGSIPDHSKSFASLQQLGIRTIISVDAATPDVALAKTVGMRYVHVPVGYHGLSSEQQLALAKALHELPGPVYIHCHHGRHRGPAAAASAAVITGLLSSAEAMAFLKQAGTSPSYPGLYACVEKAARVPGATLSAAKVELPEIAPVPPFAQAMSLAQDAYDHLAEIRDAGWRTAAAHPDLLPGAEAGQLENLLRSLREDRDARSRPTDFAAMMEQSWKASVDFEKALNSNAGREELTAALKRIDDSCRACHVAYRNRK